MYGAKRRERGRGREKSERGHKGRRGGRARYLSAQNKLVKPLNDP